MFSTTLNNAGISAYSGVGASYALSNFASGLNFNAYGGSVGGFNQSLGSTNNIARFSIFNTTGGGDSTNQSIYCSSGTTCSATVMSGLNVNGLANASAGNTFTITHQAGVDINGQGNITPIAGSIVNPNWYGVRINNDQVNASVVQGNKYGLWIGDLTPNATSSSNVYAIYQGSANTKNYFAGNVGIGTTTPSEALSIQGNINFSGYGNNSTTGVILMGGTAFLHNSGAFSNTFIGFNAGSTSYTSNISNNTAIGSNAFSRLSATSVNILYNTAIGSDALRDFDNNGWQNTAIGRGAGRGIKTTFSERNIFVGSQSQIAVR
jgi:hypothetical protein